MGILQQPPPDLAAPPPSKEAERSRRTMRAILQLGGISIAFLLILAADYGLHKMLRRPSNDSLQEALNNARQIGLCLIEFDDEYGQFPDASTVAMVKADTSTTLTLDASSSNKLFRQLILSGWKNEKLFWTHTAGSRSKPDNRFHTDATALAPGEVGFSYIPGLSSSDAPDTPVLMAPLLPGKTTFDPAPFAGKAVISFRDGSAKTMPIDRSGRVLINGMDLFDLRQPFWNGKAPDIKYPE